MQPHPDFFRFAGKFDAVLICTRFCHENVHRHSLPLDDSEHDEHDNHLPTDKHDHPSHHEEALCHNVCDDVRHDNHDVRHNDYG